jgi:exopolysaccharide biosynthesis polyprenyl glycosylphosphotransferase
LDICFTVSAFISAYFIKLHLLPEPIKGLITAPNYYIVLLFIIIIWYLSFRIFDIYDSFRKQSFAQIFWKIIKAVVSGMVVLHFVMYLLKITDVSRIMMGIFFSLNILLLGVSKGFVYKLLTHFREKGFNLRNVLIIGGRERAKDVIDAIGDRLSSGYRILGCLGLDQDEIGKPIKSGVKYIGTVDRLKNILLQEAIDEVIFAIPLNLIKDVEEQIADAKELGVSVRIVPEFQITRLMDSPGNPTVQIENFLGLPTIFLTNTPSVNTELVIKSTLEYLCAVILFILFSPLFLVIPALIKLSSKGPVFFRQERCGLNGRRFMVYKFRTMFADAEKQREKLDIYNESDGPVFKISTDPRIIPYLGTFLRKTGFDELPQLINILKGEMSLVGPRPPIPSEVEKYDFWQRRRLSMKPGITCLWQCSPKRNDLRFKDWMKLDLKYIDNWSLKLDFKILFKTALVVLSWQGK